MLDWYTTLVRGWVWEDEASGIFRSEEDLTVRVCVSGFEEDIF